MPAVIMESAIENVQDSKLEPALARDLKEHSPVENENACYRVTLQIGPHKHWQTLHGLGRNGWKIEPDENNPKESVKTTPKYLMKEVTMDGKTLNGRIQAHNDFLKSLAKNDRVGNNIPVTTLDRMLAVRKFEIIPGKIPDFSDMTPWARDRAFLEAYIDLRIAAAFEKRDKEQALALAGNKSKS